MARLVALFDMVVHEESDEGDILFNIFDELRTLSKFDEDAATGLDIAHELAFTRTSRFRAALYGTGATSPTEEPQSREE